MKHNIRFFAIIGFFAAVGVFFLFHETKALTISPVRVEISGDPGETVRGELLFINEQEGTRTFYSSFENFEAAGETGTPNFVKSNEGLATWIEAVSQITLKQGEEKKIPYAIKIPADADPGGYFAAIFWSTSSPGEKGGVSIGAKVGTLVMLKVSGEIKEGAEILEFTAENNQKFFAALPVNFTYRFRNGGGDRIKPEGEIKISNIFGGTAAILPANKSEGNILPSSIRKFEVVWTGLENKNGIAKAGKEPQKDKAEEENGFLSIAQKQWNNFAFGRYTADLDLRYGGGKEARSSFSFWIIPWQLLILAAFAAILGVIILFKGVKKYNRWIVAKAMGKQR